MWFGVILVCAVIVVIKIIPGKTIESWDSPKLLAIQKEWETHVEASRHSPKKNGRASKEDPRWLYDDILAKNLSNKELRRLAASCESLPISTQQRSEFDSYLLEYMVKVFANTGNRDSLVKLLSTRVPDPLYYTNIEWYLVRRKDKLKDPVLILGEAYAKSQVPYARRLIADALRRGFTNLGVQGKEDDEFVNNAMQWYKANKDLLAPIKHGYQPRMAPVPPFDIRAQMFGGHPPEPQYEKHPPLFVEKSSLEKSKESK